MAFESFGQSNGQLVSQLVNIGQFWSVSPVMWSQLVGFGQSGGWSAWFLWPVSHLINNDF